MYTNMAMHMHGSISCLVALLGKGANRHLVANNGDTPLDLAEDDEHQVCHLAVVSWPRPLAQVLMLEYAAPRALGGCPCLAQELMNG